MVATQVTEESMMVAGMSAYMSMSDQYMTMMGMPQAAFMAVGSDEAGLVLMNADTITSEKIQVAIQEQEEKDQDALDIAADIIIADMEERLERLKEPVTYANGQFTIGGITVDEEDMDAAVDDTVDNFDAFVAQHDLDAEQAAALYALLLAYQNTDDPEVKARILNDIKTDISPNVALDMAQKAQERFEQRTEELTTKEAAQREAFVEPTQEVSIAQKEAVADTEQGYDRMAMARSGTDFGNPFAARRKASDEYNASAQGDITTVASNEVEPATPNQDVTNTAPSIIPA